MQKIINIVHCHYDRLGIHICRGESVHLSGKFKDGFLVKSMDILFGHTFVCFQNIQIAESISRLHFHSALNAETGYQSYCDNKMISEISQRVVWQNSRSASTERCHYPLNAIDIAFFYAFVKFKFLFKGRVSEPIFSVKKSFIWKFLFSLWHLTTSHFIIQHTDKNYNNLLIKKAKMWYLLCKKYV